MNVGLLKGVDLSVDSTPLRADASPDRTVTDEQLPEVAKLSRTVREYVEQVERENIVAEPTPTSDPSASETKVDPNWAVLIETHHPAGSLPTPMEERDGSIIGQHTREQRNAEL